MAFSFDTVAVSQQGCSTNSASVHDGVQQYAAESSSSLVHTLETKPPLVGVFIRHRRFGSYEHDTEPVTEEESTFRHSGWAARRSQIWQAFARCCIGDSRLSRFANCGSGLWLSRSETGDDLHLSCNKCHDRWCIPCQNDRAALIREKVAQYIAGRHVRLLTLTLRHSATPLRDQIARLYTSFSTLRRRQSWRQHVTGGVAFLETKVSEKTGLWHVHLHMLIEGTFWEVREISREWHAVTGDSCIVDLRAVKDSANVASYVTKYVTKPADSSVYAQQEKLDELIVSLRGTRLALPFGTWRHLKLMEKMQLNVTWIPIASVCSLRSRASTGDVEAVRWLEAATRRWPLFETTFTFANDSS